MFHYDRSIKWRQVVEEARDLIDLASVLHMEEAFYSEEYSSPGILSMLTNSL